MEGATDDPDSLLSTDPRLSLSFKGTIVLYSVMSSSSSELSLDVPVVNVLDAIELEEGVECLGVHLLGPVE